MELKLYQKKRNSKIRILIVKTSSLGDIIHTLPALTDAARAIPNIKFDWVIEERFQAIPKKHSAVDRVIPINLRRWKKDKNFRSIFFGLKNFKKILNEKHYDLVIDAQGLLKSAFITLLIKAPAAGYQTDCIREKIASYFYRYRYDVSWNQHAVERIRQLFSAALYYPRPESSVDYGLSFRGCGDVTESPYVLLFHGTTWANKHWPEKYWKALIQLLNQKNLHVKLSWGSPEEYERSCRLAENTNAELLPRLDLEGLMPVIANAKAVVAVDTGLCHLASALNIPTIALFGPTDPEKTGVFGVKQLNLAANFACSPCLKRECAFKGEGYDTWPACFSTLPPMLVMQRLMEFL